MHDTQLDLWPDSHADTVFDIDADSPFDPPADFLVEDSWTDGSPDIEYDTSMDPASDSSYDPVSDPAVDPPPDTASDVASDTAPDSLVDTTVDTFVDTAPDTATDPAPDGPASCAGTLVGGYCWYLGSNETQHCDIVCSSHGGYSEATRSYAGSGGTNANCESVLTALGVPYPGVSTLVGSGEGVGCFYMTVANVRYRVADTPTVSDATYILSRRACACNL